jgi:hypothetical protein
MFNCIGRDNMPSNGHGAYRSFVEEWIRNRAADCDIVSVRAERSSAGDGRVYSAEWVVGDAYGNLTHAVCAFGIPHDKGKKSGPAVNGAPDFASALYAAECALDSDLDGIADEGDNCPGLPNETQADADADGVGDACDICPADDQDNCLTDPDGDGVPDEQDNCPNTPNPLQEDGDLDGKGDVCDPCPADPDPDCTPEPPPPPPPPPPGGEGCADALNISAGGHFTGTLAGATNDIVSYCSVGALADFAMRFDIPLGHPLGIQAAFQLAGSVDVTYTLFKGGCAEDMVSTCLGAWGDLHQMTLTTGTYYLVAEGPNDPQGTLEESIYSVWFTMKDALTGECLMPDGDGDGLTACDGDCDDGDATSFPGGIEACDGHDNDCDGQEDEMSGACDTGTPGICAPGTLSCDPETYEEVCLPVQAPKAEICEDGKDNDCDGEADEAECELPPGGEDCASPIEIGMGGTFSGTLDGALDDLPSGCFGEPTADLIFRLEVPATEFGMGYEVFFNTQGSEGVTFSLLKGPCEAAVMMWGCFGGEMMSAQLGAGEYFILVEAQPWLPPEFVPLYNVTILMRDPVTGECLTPDGDGDGATTCDGDCNDGDPLTSPWAEEICDGKDNNCDGGLDNVWGTCDTGLFGICATGHTQCEGDLELCVQWVYPKTEVCGDGKDNDCNGQTDEPRCLELPPGETCGTAIDATAGGTFVGTLTGAFNDVPDYCFPGEMGDMVYKIDGTQLEGPVEIFARLQASSDMGISVLLGNCEEGMVMNCAWQGETISFGIGSGPAFIVVDGMGMPDGPMPDEPWPADYTLLVALYHPDTGECNPPDGDGDGVSICRGDCDDADPLRSPGAEEVCDGLDNNCDGGLDNIWGACETGLAGLCGEGQWACQGPDVVCMQNNWPGVEVCSDGADNDCDGLIDEDGIQDPEQSCEVQQPPGGGDCCEAHSYPGCGDQEVMDCVCMGMGMLDCCEMEWHPLCAGMAAEMCGACW